MQEVEYVQLMSQKDSQGRFGPRPQPRAQSFYETKWRTEPSLYKKVRAAAAVEGCKAETESDQKGQVKISVNAQLNFIVEQFIATYEERFGALPDPDDESAVKRYAQKSLAK